MPGSIAPGLSLIVAERVAPKKLLTTTSSTVVPMKPLFLLAGQHPGVAKGPEVHCAASEQMQMEGRTIG